MANRTTNSVRNTSVGLIGKIATIIFNFIKRTVFIYVLDATYLGISGLFTNILTVLSLSELGFGTAMVYAMYQPIATSDEKKISALMNFYAKVYRIVGVFVLVAGCALIPHLGFFIGDPVLPADLPPLWIIYLLYLLNTASSYFFSYKRSLITACQKDYINSVNNMLFDLIRIIGQTIILFAFKDFILYLVLQLICTLASNIAISRKADKLFPYLKKHKDEKLSKQTKGIIGQNVFAMSCHKLGGVVVSGTDNILISKFVGLVATGCYYNYTMITSAVSSIYNQIFNAITASAGNLIALESEEDVYKVYKKLLFMNGYIAVFCTSCLVTLIHPFMSLLWGGLYVFDDAIMYVIMLNFFLTCMRKTNNVYINAGGLFWPLKWKALAEAVINLGASIFLAEGMHMGVLGVVLGTTISSVLTNFWWEPYVVYKKLLHKNLGKYFALIIQYFLLTLISIALCNFLFAFFGLPENLLGLILKGIIAVIIPNLILLVYFRTPEYKYFLTLVFDLVRTVTKGKIDIKVK